tara:strand:+ start:116 stop:634 length:519 start_codon:yes stop_codon:yes gene_type:complete
MAQDSYKDILDYEVPEGTVSLCKEKHSSGYNWVNGEWIDVNYQLETYIIKKLHYKDINNNDVCRYGINENESIEKVETFESLLGEAAYIKRCYSIKSLGEEENYTNFNVCSEHYNKNELTHIFCRPLLHSDMAFNINGLFVLRHWEPDLNKNPKNDYKSSIQTSHGVCGTIN